MIKLLTIFTINIFLSGCFVTSEEFTDAVNQLHSHIDQRLDKIHSPINLPIGVILPFSGEMDKLDNKNNTYILCDGRGLKVEKYKELFSVIGWKYGYGNELIDKKYFSVPDLRGMFIRGVDGDRNLDIESPKRTDAVGNLVGDKVGSMQDHQFERHNHPITDPGHAHPYSAYAEPASNRIDDGGSIGFQWHSRNTSSARTNVLIQDAGESEETRPVNISVYYLIKAR
ncbi:MAG: phage tail protein [Melioribacteraceae bacterium]